MLLAIDVGNSNISLGIFRDAALLMKGRISVRTRRSADEYAAIVYDLMRMNQIAREELDGCILASVVPELTGLVEEAAWIITGTNVLRDQERRGNYYVQKKNVGTIHVYSSTAAYLLW